MTNQSNQPAAVIRDGSIKLTIWKNSSEKGAFYTTVPSRTYQDAEGKLQDGDSFTNAELLRLAHLASKAYDTVTRLRARDRLEGDAAKLNEAEEQDGI